MTRTPPARLLALLPRPSTLRARVSQLAVVVIAGWLLVLAVGLDVVLIARVNSQVQDTLRVRAEAASALIVQRDGRIVGVRESAADGRLDGSIWVYSGTRAVERPRLPSDVQQVADSLAGTATGFTKGAGHRFYVLPVQGADGRTGTVVAALNFDPFEDTQHVIVVATVVVGVLLLAGAYPVLLLATRRALQPVEQMTRQAADWSAHTPTSRFGDDQRFAELSTLAGTLDEMLERIAAVLRHERALSAELSHELRTPLARIAAQVELTLDGARPDQRAELREIRDSCSAMDEIIETLLAAARSDATSAVGRCALDPVLTELAAQPDAPSVVARTTGLGVGVERATVLRVLTPLVDNARRYARTQVLLDATRHGSDVLVTVTDDGGRLDADDLERVFEPGLRADPDDGHPGAGLGLPLARRLARAAGGDVRARVTDGSTVFVVTLPAG